MKGEHHGLMGHNLDKKLTKTTGAEKVIHSSYHIKVRFILDEHKTEAAYGNENSSCIPT